MWNKPFGDFNCKQMTEKKRIHNMGLIEIGRSKYEGKNKQYIRFKKKQNKNTP